MNPFRSIEGNLAVLPAGRSHCPACGTPIQWGDEAGQWLPCATCWVREGRCPTLHLNRRLEQNPLHLSENPPAFSPEEVRYVVCSLPSSPITGACWLWKACP